MAAPPPVEIWVNFSFGIPSRFTASEVSPPPRIEVHSCVAMHSAIIFVPLPNCGNS